MAEVTPGVPEMTGAIDDPKVRLIMDYQAAVARGDLQSARTVFHPEVYYRVPGRSSFAGDYHGPDAVMGYFGRLMEETGGSYSISKMHWLASGDQVALLTRNHAQRRGHSLDWDEVIVFLFEDDKKRRIDLFSADQYAVDEFFG